MGSCTNNTSSINKTFIIEPSETLVTGGTVSACTAIYTNEVIECDPNSGVTINTKGYSCPWDSGQVGYIWVSKEKRRNEYSISRVTSKWVDKIEEYLNNEIETFAQYIEGDVYSFSVEEWDPTPGVGWVVTDSCAGFYGTDWDTNGIKDYIPNDLVGELEDIEVSW